MCSPTVFIPSANGCSSIKLPVQMATALKAISLEAVHEKPEVWHYSQQAGEWKTTSNKCILSTSLHSASSLLEFWIHDKANVKREK